MFLGQYQHRIDSKGRLIIPSRYRDLLAEGAYVTQGFDRNLMVLTPRTFQNISERVNNMSLTDPAARQLRRLIFATADNVEVDRTGRILIPQFLREVAHLDGEVIVVGAGSYFEIWAADEWQQRVGEILDTEANAQRFAAFDLSAPE
ncbi:MAG: division/cell wall cluster transcriptional repressor MraZ [Anaerolineales bacterium]